MKTILLAALVAACALAGTAKAEFADYGAIELNGLARDTTWPYNAPGLEYAMICNVNGPDGFLAVRSGPGTEYATNRSLKRLAIVTIDTRLRHGNWVRVNDAHRAFSTDGERLADSRSLAVEGWAHDGYLCSYIDY